MCVCECKWISLFFFDWVPWYRTQSTHRFFNFFLQIFCFFTVFFSWIRFKNESKLSNLIRTVSRFDLYVSLIISFSLLLCMHSVSLPSFISRFFEWFFECIFIDALNNGSKRLIWEHVGAVQTFLSHMYTRSAVGEYTFVVVAVMIASFFWQFFW